MKKSSSRRIVVVAHFCPFPSVHGNRRRLVALLKWLKSHGLSVIYILQPLDVEGRDGIAQLRTLVDRLDIVHSPHGDGWPAALLKRISSRLARALLPERATAYLRHLMRRNRPPADSVKETWGSGDVGGDGHIDRWCWSTTCEVVHRAVKKYRPIAVIAQYALMSKCLECLPPATLKVIDTHEIFFRNQERFHVDGLAAPFVCSPESEKIALNRADVLVAIQRNDAQALKEVFPRKRIVTVPHTYAQGRPRASSPDAATVLYVASPNAFNVHGLQQFLKEAWQPILERVPDATLRVIGGVASGLDVDARRVAKVGRITDEELAREYQTATVVINPQVAGTGLKIKCVEALTAGCPLVMNQAGADGLEKGAGTAFLLARDWREFSHNVVRILTDSGLRQQLESQARTFAAEMFSAAATFSELERVLSEGASAMNDQSN
jgi:glycosyltransferase involved in cell wall biosynthesis